MVKVNIDAMVRLQQTGSYKHRLRKQGKIPAVIYGVGIGSEPIELDSRDLEAAIHKNGQNTLINVSVEGRSGHKKHVVILKELQRDPIRRQIVHADFCKISMKDVMHTTVPVVLKGDAMGVKAGGILQPGARQIDIECMPANIPESIIVDVSSLGVGDHLILADLSTPDNYRFLTEPETVLVTVIAPRMTDQVEEGEVKESSSAVKSPNGHEETQKQSG